MAHPYHNWRGQNELVKNVFFCSTTPINSCSLLVHDMTHISSGYCGVTSKYKGKKFDVFYRSKTDQYITKINGQIVAVSLEEADAFVGL